MATSHLFFDSALLLLACLLPFSLAWDIGNKSDRESCQYISNNPLDGCDRNRTRHVDGLGNGSAFTTIQAAVESLPKNNDTFVILIAPGNYTEQVNVTRQGPTYLLGQSASPSSHHFNTVNILWAATAIPNYPKADPLTDVDNAFTSTLTIAPTLNASLTGTGPTGFDVPADTPFGCSDFRTFNLNIHNVYRNYAVSPSLALSISRANAGFYYTSFYSYQDTIYVGKLGNAYFSGGEVAGETDFLYGFGTAWLSETALTLRGCGGGIAAWKGANTTFENKYGVYVVNSWVKKENETATGVGKCALGRPWNINNRAIFAKTYLDDSILPTGYIDWEPARYTKNITLQAEYKNYGPGFNATARAQSLYDVQLTNKQWAEYDGPAKVFQDEAGNFGNVDWIDFEVGTKSGLNL